MRFLWHRFLDDRCLQVAGALAYTTLFALVPLITAALGILTAFPVFAEWREQITRFMFENFVPSAGDVIQDYFTQFAASASKATVIGVLVLLFSAVSLMNQRHRRLMPSTVSGACRPGAPQRRASSCTGP